MKPVEIMAVIVATAVIIKLALGFVIPRSLPNAVMKKALTNPILTTLISLAWAIAALIFLLKELTIVQIFAVMLFLMPLMMISLLPFAEDMLMLVERIFRDRNILKKAGPGIIVWLILAIWVLYVLFV